MMLLGFFVNAQKGYWYDTSFIELNETNKDVVYAIESDSKQYRFNSGRFISNLDRKNSYYNSSLKNRYMAKRLCCAAKEFIGNLSN